MIEEMWTLLTERTDFFAGLLLEHLEISLLAIVIAILAGGLAGILISEFQRTAKPALAVINFLYTIPSISMLGFLIPFSGVGNATAVIALTVYALLPMVRNTHTGMVNVDPLILEAAKGMGSTRMQILFKIKLPLAMPVIMSGIRSMVTMTIALAGIASYIGAGGLGVAIYRGITTNNSAMTMTGSLLIAVLALVVDFLLGFLERRMKMRSSKAKEMNRFIEHYASEHGEQPSVKEIAAAFSMDEGEVVFTLGSSKMPISLYEQSDYKDEKSSELCEKLPSEDKQDEMIERMILKSAIEKLPERERKIVFLRYFRDMTQSEVARRIGVSQVQISRIENKKRLPNAHFPMELVLRGSA